MTSLRLIDGDEFADKYPTLHKGPSNKFIVTALELRPGQGFEVECPGQHYYRDGDLSRRYACAVQNYITRYAREHKLTWKTTHSDTKLMVYYAPDSFDMSVDVELAKQVRATDRVIEELVMRYAGLMGGADNVRREIDDALNHKAASKRRDKKRYLIAWLKRAAERYQKKSPAVSSAADLYRGQP
jgi:hypothetical protein